VIWVTKSASDRLKVQDLRSNPSKKTVKEVKKRKKRSRERLKYQKGLIEKIKVFNMGWFGITKASWRTIGFAIALLGAIFLITGNTLQIGTVINISGFVLLVIGLIISMVNG